MRKIRKWLGFIDWSASMVLATFLTAAFTLAVNCVSVWIWVPLVGLGISLASIAAVNAYQDRREKQFHQVVALKQEFDSSMKEERIRAADVLLERLERIERCEIGPNFTGGKEQLSAVDAILDFFSTRVASMALAGQLGKNDVYDCFFRWIQGYWHATVEYRKSQANHKWDNFAQLYKEAFEIYKTRERSEDWEFTPDAVRTFLHAERAL